MKTAVGVDLAENYLPALRMCLDLDFPDQSFLFVHAVEPVPPYAPPMQGGALDTMTWIKHLHRAGETAVDKAKIQAGHIPSESRVLNGSAASILMTVSEGENVDLIAMGSEKRSGLMGFVAGSVARALAIGSKCSILATKGEWTSKQSMKAVFATDHSEYANKAFEKLIQWSPKGLSQIDVLSAYEVDEGYVIAIPEAVVDTDVAVETFIKDRLQKLTEEARDTLMKAGYKSEAHVVRGYPNSVIGEHMKSFEADLLIVGAQGHGFMERLFVGSTALHQVVTEPYPVLVIRT